MNIVSRYINENEAAFKLMIADFLQMIALGFVWIKLDWQFAFASTLMWYGLWLMITHIIDQNEKNAELLERVLSK